MFSVIIPALNEAANIADVIAFARGSPLVGEVLVVDDGSLDGTPEQAWAAGACVLTSSLLGKGASMEDGLRAAGCPFVLYLDGDLSGLHPELIERMAAPLLAGHADLVKARFQRQAGRVTLLTAKPLLKTFFPELAGFDQPLGGIVAARRDLLRGLAFENDYGVDVGLLIDAWARGARMAEVDIGRISHESQPLERLGAMANQVVRTILDRAARHRRLDMAQIQNVQEEERHMQADLPTIMEKLGRPRRLALLDMDGTLLQGRYVRHLARLAGKEDELMPLLDHPEFEAQARCRRIAALFAGVPMEVFAQAAREVPLMPGAQTAVLGLRKLGFTVGIVTDSYRIASETVRRRVFADFSLAHLLNFQQARATGEITICPPMFHPEGCPHHSFCKVNVLRHLLGPWDLTPEDVLAVGDGENDICLLRAAGTSVAFHPANRRVQAAASHVLFHSLTGLLEVAQGSHSRVPA